MALKGSTIPEVDTPFFPKMPNILTLWYQNCSFYGTKIVCSYLMSVNKTIRPTQKQMAKTLRRRNVNNSRCWHPFFPKNGQYIHFMVPKWCVCILCL